MKKFVLKCLDVEIGVVFGDDYEFVEDMIIIYLDGYTVGSFKMYLEGFSIRFYEVENA